MNKKIKLTSFQMIMHIAAWIPLLALIYDFIYGRLSVNPIQDVEQRTGRTAITWLVFSLAASPLSSLTGWKELIKRRRAMGLYAFFYAAIHLTTFVALDFGFAWQFILIEITERRYIIVGAIGFTLLALLALTSFKWWMKRLGKNWKRLHRTIYLIAPLLVLHFAWARKGDIFSLQGDIVKPLVYGLVVILLLVLRLPGIRKRLSSVRKRVRSKTTQKSKVSRLQITES